VTDFEVTSGADEGTDHAFRLTVRGELDVETSARLSDEIAALCERGARWVTIDAAGLGFVDSTGLRAITQAGQLLTAREGQLFIEGLSPAMQRLLEISGLLDMYRRPTSDPD
jgi:anti-anti-sigma factor